MAVDYSDPCARFAALRDAYYSLVSGATESLIRYRGPEGEREVRFVASKLEVLKAELRDAETACAAANGTPLANGRRRYAITAGAQRPSVGGDWWSVGDGRFVP